MLPFIFFILCHFIYEAYVLFRLINKVSFLITYFEIYSSKFLCHKPLYSLGKEMTLTLYHVQILGSRHDKLGLGLTMSYVCIIIHCIINKNTTIDKYYVLKVNEPTSKTLIKEWANKIYQIRLWNHLIVRCDSKINYLIL